MTDGDMERISSLKKQEKSAAAIAETLGLPLNTVKSYLRRHPGTEDAHICPQCGKAVTQNKGRKEKRFCSDKCRMGWLERAPVGDEQKSILHAGMPAVREGVCELWEPGKEILQLGVLREAQAQTCRGSIRRITSSHTGYRFP